MERLTYILDSNAVAEAGHYVCLCQPVYYEVLRGLLKTNATRKLYLFHTAIMPMLNWIPLTDEDWRQAAQFWADTVRKGKQLADTDLLIGAITKRVNGVLVTADNDFDALPVQRENWR